MSRGTDDTFYDDVEANHLPWLKDNLPNYLASDVSQRRAVSR